jgi:hypothetical protein
MGGNPSMNARTSPTYATGLRLLLLTILLAALQPAPPLVTVGPPQTVQTTYPRLGVHTRLTDEVEEWKIKRTLEMVREMGATTIIEFFPWAYYQAEDGGIAWDHPDMVIDHAHAQGLNVIARIGLTPDWARPPDTPLTYLDATAYDDFAAFAAAFAARYAGRVQGIIVGNEPNLSYEWGYRPTTAEDYAALLAAVYPAIKAADPTMTVLAGALAPTLEPDGSPWGTNDLLYLDRLYDAGAAPNFDALAVHVYGLTFPPDTPPDPGVLNFRRVELMREVMVRHDDAATPMMITETGWNDHPRWTQAVRPALRLTYTLDALDRAAADWPYVELVGLWSFRYPAPTRSYMDYYTLVTPEFVRKPIYDALQAYTGNMPP